MTERESISGQKFAIKRGKGILPSRLNGPSSATPRKRECTNPYLEHYTDLFSHVLRAAREPIDLDDRQANAVAARIELDLRIGAAFTRLQTLQLQNLAAVLANKTISYGMSL